METNGKELRSPDSPTLPIDQEIAEYEEAAAEMLDRMQIMLDTISSVSKEKDPSKRLEVFAFFFINFILTCKLYLTIEVWFLNISKKLYL